MRVLVRAHEYIEKSDWIYVNVLQEYYCSEETIGPLQPGSTKAVGRKGGMLNA